MTERSWVATGHLQSVDPGEVDRVPPFDPRSGDHLWSVVVAYRVDPAKFADATATPILDRENLLAVAGPGCYYCERPYTERLALRRCPGAP